jgi:hypothetical protein
MPSRSFKYLLLLAPLCLAACGEGWEMVRVTNVVPYGNSRTAGSGVAYVRAKMLPKKEVQLAPAQAPVVVETKAETKVEETKPEEPSKAMEKVFSKKQQK